MLQLKNCTLERKGRPLLSITNIFLEKGRCYPFFGRNGSGKTSFFLGLLGGLGTELLGDIQVLGQSIEELAPERRLQMFSSYLGDRSSPAYVTVTMALNMALTGSLSASLDGSQRQRFERVVQVFDLSPLLEEELDSLSAGQLQRCFVARALLKEASVYLFDEPTSFLDYHYKKIVLEGIKKIISEENSLCLLSGHDIQEFKNVFGPQYLNISESKTLELSS